MGVLESLEKSIMPGIARMYRRSTGIHKYGLIYDDIRAETETVNKALRRLPYADLEERDRRLKIAFDCSMKKELLPEAQWTNTASQKYYLKPFVDQVKQEELEREAFRK